MRLKVTGILLTAFVLCAAGAFAQEPEKKALDTSLKVSGVIFTEYAYLTGYQPGSAWNQQIEDTGKYRGQNENQNSTFRVNRVYLNFRKNISETVSMRVTTDVEGSDTTALNLYLKYAFVQYQESFFGFMTVNFQFGLIGTPIIGLMDDISDCRWIYQNLYDKSANLLRGFGADSSADFGLRLSLTFANMVTVTGGVVNGEGYKKATETAGSNFDGKAYFATLTVNPIASVYINGFFRYEEDAADNTAASSGISSEVLYGFGAAYKSKLITAGVHAFYLWNNDKSGAYRIHTSYMLAEAYVMANLGEVIPSVPLLIHGRYGYGIEYGNEISNGSEDYTTQMLAFGLGWQFVDGLRVLAYYETYMYDRNTDVGYELPLDASNFMVKAEVKF